jgi:hypothetical protein
MPASSLHDPPGADFPSDSGNTVRWAKVTIACETCRSRRVKVCVSILYFYHCVCAGPANLLAKEQKENIEELDNDKNALFGILWYLQMKSPDQATALLGLLRLNQGGIGVMCRRCGPSPWDRSDSMTKIDVIYDEG